MLDSFLPKRRPQIIDRNNETLFTNGKLCPRFLVLMRSWDDAGTGRFFGEPLAGDMLRAAAYKRARFNPVMKKEGERLQVLLLNRDKKRVILNFSVLLRALKTNSTTSFSFIAKNITSESAVAQVQLFAKTDILIAAHGAGITNAMYMLSGSHIVEIFPPFWYFGCYRKLVDNLRLSYSKVISHGERGPECKTDPKSMKCLIDGTRDRNFYVDVTAVKHALKEGYSLVWKNKFGVSVQ